MNIPKMITLASALAAPLTFSAGFMVNEQSVSSVARANAGRGVIGDNAADIAHNPAATSLFDTQSVSVTFHYVDPNINVKGSHITPAGTKPVKADDVAPAENIPNFYYVLPIDEQFSFGLSLNSHFGMSTEYNNFPASEFANKTSIKTYYVTPSFAWKINDMFSVGVGLSYIYGKGEIKNTAPFNIPAPPRQKGDTLLDIKGSGSAFGWDIGGIWQITDGQRLGLNYRSRVNLKADSDVTSLAKTTDKKGVTHKGSGDITFNLPDTLELSYFNQINETFALAAGVQWINWSRFKNLTINIDAGDDYPSDKYMFKKENWKDGYRLSLGGDYRLNKIVNLHAGYAFDKSPVLTEYRTLTIPDANRNWFTIGSTLDFESAGIVDLAFAYVKGNKVKVKEGSSALDTEFDGELTKVDAMIFSVGYSYNF